MKPHNGSTRKGNFIEICLQLRANHPMHITSATNKQIQRSNKQCSSNSTKLHCTNCTSTSIAVQQLSQLPSDSEPEQLEESDPDKADDCEMFAFAAETSSWSTTTTIAGRFWYLDTASCFPLNYSRQLEWGQEYGVGQSVMAKNKLKQEQQEQGESSWSLSFAFIFQLTFHFMLKIWNKPYPGIPLLNWSKDIDVSESTFKDSKMTINIATVSTIVAAVMMTFSKKAMFRVRHKGCQCNDSCRSSARHCQSWIFIRVMFSMNIFPMNVW